MRRLFVAAFAALTLVVLAAGPASAHATLVSSDPADGSAVDALPETIELIFNEAVSSEASTAEFVDSDGNVYETQLRSAAGNPSVLLVDIGETPDGLYSLRWSAFSATDGHVTRGMLVWGVGDVDLADAAFAEPSDPANPVELLGRWVLFTGFALALGAGTLALTAVARVRRRFGSDEDRVWHDFVSTRLASLSAIGMTAAAAAALGLIVLQVWRAFASGGFDFLEVIDLTVLSTRWGHLALVRLVLLVAAAVIVRRRPAASLPVLVGAVLAHGAAGHAAGLTDAGFAVTNDIVHLLASLTWGGAVIALASLVSRTETDRARMLRASTAREFSSLAVVLGVAATATGFFSIGRMVQAVDGLAASGYGQMLIAKIVLVATLAFLGLRARRRSSEQQGVRRPAAIVVAGILLLVAGVTSTSTATGGQWLEPVDGTARQLALVSNDVQIGMTVTPNVPGQNFVLIDAASTRRPEPGPIVRVLVRVEALDVDRSRVTLEAEAVEPVGSFEVPTTMFSVPGRYEIEVVVRRLGLPDETATFQWSVATADPDPAVLSFRPLAELSDPLGALLALAGASFLLSSSVTAIRRDRRVRELEAFAASAESDTEVRP